MSRAFVRAFFRCCNWLERTGDWLTGAAGPFFVALATALISTGIFLFFTVILPTLPFPFLLFPPCALIATNLLAHYHYACTVPPGFVDDDPRAALARPPGLIWARPRNGAQSDAPPPGLRVTRAAVRRCKRCRVIRPERAHHCRICKHCVLKYDHHCPVRINQCVGVNNERHFLLFMAYVVVAAFFFCAFGYKKAFHALGFTWEPWPHTAPALLFLLLYILALVLCLAVAVMLGWHLHLVAVGETTVESQDFEVYRKACTERGETFVNSYNLGARKNLELFFNVGPTGYPLYTLLLPLCTHPYTDGWAWARAPGCERHGGVREGEELTDVEEGEGEA